MLEAIAGFFLSGLFINSVAYILGSVVLGIVTAYIAKLKPRDSILAFVLFAIMGTFQFFFRLLQGIAPERVIGQVIYFGIFLLATYYASRHFYNKKEEEEVKELENLLKNK